MTWEIDASHTTAQFAVKHLMISTVKGHFQKVQGKLELDEAEPTRSTVDVAIDAASVDTRDPNRDAHLRAADFFDVEHYPAITFKSKRIERNGGPNRFYVVGDLTIRDVTREVVLNTQFEGQAKDPWGNRHAAFTAETKINRKDYGLNWNAPLEAGGVLLSEEVKIALDVQAVQKS